MRTCVFFLIVAAVLAPRMAAAQQDRRPYRLNSVDLKQPVIWGPECRLPDGHGLAFGGQNQDGSDGRPHTRVLRDDEWVPIADELRTANPLQAMHVRVWSVRYRPSDRAPVDLGVCETRDRAVNILALHTYSVLHVQAADLDS